MQLPIDVKAVIDEAMDIEGARTTPLSVSVYIDDTAPGDVIGHVRSAFASASAHTRVTVGYLNDSDVVPFPGDDMAVIVAGLSERVGAQTAIIRASGVPVMVATTLPRLVEDIAQAAGTPIPHDDVVAPETPHNRLLDFIHGDATEMSSKDKKRTVVGVNKAVPASGQGVVRNFLTPRGLREATPASAVTASVSGAASPEPYVLDKQAAEALDRRMGEWIIDACRDKRLAFALAFPFVRRPLSIDTVNATALQNAGVGLVIFIPGADLPIMTLNQAKMLLQIAAAYGETLGVERVKELAAVVGGAFAFRGVARQMVAFVPALGWAIKAAIGYTGTLAMGRAAIEYYEEGGNIVGLMGVVSSVRDKVVDTTAAAHSCLTTMPSEDANVKTQVSSAAPAGVPLQANASTAPFASVSKDSVRTAAATARTAAVRVQGAARSAASAAVPLAKSVVQASADAVGSNPSAIAATAATAVFDVAKSRLFGRR